MDITSKIVTSFLDSLYTCENDKLKELRHFAEEKNVPIIMKNTEKLLLNLLKIKNPQHILEIGTAIGYSACAFADACGCRVTTIEANEEAYNIALSNIKNLGFEDRIEVLHGDARDVLLSLTNRAVRGCGSCEPADAEDFDGFDVVFIDAAKSHYRAFWDLAIPLCCDDALIICDNILMKGMTVSDECDPRKKYKTSIRKMREFVNYINSLSYAETSILPVGDGVSISIIDKESMKI